MPAASVTSPEAHPLPAVPESAESLPVEVALEALAAPAPALARRKPAARKPAATAKTPVASAASQALAEVATPPAKPRKAAAALPAAPSGEVPAKPAKLKLVRDSFTIPRAEYETISALKARALKLERSVKKSELLRAGLMLLAGLDDAALLRAVDAVPPLKTGRPKKAKDKAEASSAQTATKRKPAKG
ncbi:hypothetical protein [Caldimonas tepidiphila]|uniref:hypothetical protein n=1 Tax=Caldimonas tepidiphila TaxID=2315841 RepID=UPI001F0BB56B|nr:hypothetical protein [Caldimonas tepidiphila]